jgi:hypothetical protein
MSEEKSYPEDKRQKIEQEILQAIRGISYGSVEVLIHNAKIVQILRKEKVRFDQNASVESH